MPFANSRSAVPTCWRCTSVGTRTSGSGCIDDGGPMSEPGRILVVAPNWIGDAVMALPALADIRRAFAQARLIVAARHAVAPLYSMVPGVDATMVTQWRGSVTDRRRLQEDVQQLLAEQVDRVFLF